MKAADASNAPDAAHLLRTVNAAVNEGITSVATVHDSFGCLPSRAARFRRLIREEFVRMYTEHDVLAEVYGQTRVDLSDPDAKRMPSGPPDRLKLSSYWTLSLRSLDLVVGSPSAKVVAGPMSARFIRCASRKPARWGRLSAKPGTPRLCL
jgi:DNA-dependent RNA polymerase